MELRKIRAGFVGFGEVNSPPELISRKCKEAQAALEALGLEIIATAPVCDDARGEDEARARRELHTADFDLLVACVAGWIPSHTIIDVISDFRHNPIALWGLTGSVENGRLVTTADQAGTSAVRDTLDALGFKFKYIYDTYDAPYSGAAKVKRYGEIARAAALLQGAKIGMMGYRDMGLFATLTDILALRRVLGVDIEVFEMLEIVQRMETIEPSIISNLINEIRKEWAFDKPVTDEALQTGIRMYAAVMQKMRERNYQAISLVDVDGVKKLLHFPPAMPLLLLADKGKVASIPENDSLGAVTQLIVRYLTGQVGAYLEFYEYMTDRFLMGVPDYVPSEVVDGKVHVLPWPGFGGLKNGILNVSKIKTGKVTLCRLGSRGDRYKMHIVTGEAVTPRPWEEAGWEPPAPQLPSLEIIPDCSVDDFAQQVLGQHYIIAYGDHKSQYADFCKLMHIEVISH